VIGARQQIAPKIDNSIKEIERLLVVVTGIIHVINEG
jgi:hypothetical protein